jgi:choice-of-anchor A domain-containing protein
MPPPPCTNCVDPVFALGAASGISVLELGPGSVSITGPAGGILGDIDIAPGSSLSMSGSEYITGTVRLGAGAKFNNSSSGVVGGVQQNVDLSAQINAAYAANSANAALPCTQTFTTLDGKSVKTITGVSGVNVICVKDIVLNGTQISLTGPADAKFVFNITGKLVLTGGGAGPQIRVDASKGIPTSAVLYNLIGAGQDVAFSGGGGGVNCCAAIVDGTILAPYRKIALSPGLVNGEVISGQNISIVSGSSVHCPSCPPNGGI